MNDRRLGKAVLRRVSVLAATLGVFIYSSAVFAQSSSGEIFGQVTSGTGASIKIENLESGLHREVSVDSKGRYSFEGLPTGPYTVTLIQDGHTISTQQTEVSAGLGAPLNFQGEVKQLEGVKVIAKASNAIDVTRSETSITFSAKQLQQIPVSRDVVGVALLTPSASPANPSLGVNLPSFGGSSVAENSYYINGFEVTNLFDNLAFSEVPFEGIQDQQVIIGGYGPEFGRSTGGVISVETKRGTNQFLGGVSTYWEPDALRGDYPNIHYGNGRLVQQLGDYSKSETEAAAWIGGPIVKNHLFFYGLAEKTWFGVDQNGRAQDTGPGTPVDYTATHEREPFLLGKIDWDINSSNIIEVTGIKDTKKYNNFDYGDSYNGPPGETTTRGAYIDDLQQERGGSIYFGKYTSNITDDLTASAQWGKLKYKESDILIEPDGSQDTFNGVLGNLNQPGCIAVSDQTPNGALEDGNDQSNACPGNSLVEKGAEDNRTAWRADLEYKLHLGSIGPVELGLHDLKAGFEHDHFNSHTGSTVEGGYTWTYNQVDDTGNPNDPDNGKDFVEQTIFQTLANADVISRAYYIKDAWHVTDRILLNLGLRDDSFNNKTSGVSYVKQDNILQPRIGAVWDVHGNSTLKVFANYGQYSLPITASVAVRGASASIYSVQDFDYTGVDPTTGEPTGLSPTPTNDPNYHSAAYFVNGENGSVPNPGSVADRHLQPIEQSEYILGAQLQIADNLIGGIRGIYRNLDKTIDDSCDLRPVAQYAASHYGLTIGDNTSTGSPAPYGVPGCFIFNPGSGADLSLPLNGDSRLYDVNLSAADIGEPKAKRVYDAVEFTLEKTLSNHWYMQGSYTLAHSYGNTEGLVKSSIGQTDTGTTEDFDFPEIMRGAYGNQSNDHRHTVKLYGAYNPIKEITFGANFLLQSGSPTSCLGVSPNTAQDPYGYGNGFHFCNGKLVPQGTAGHTDTISQVDLNLQYHPQYAKGLTVSVAVFNLFDAHGVESTYQYGESGSGSSYVGTRYQTPYAGGYIPYQQSRYFRLAAEYDFQF